ncbi:MAG: acetate kinase [Mobilicoccus sp.]|nr:acetate kinase [Mobilicoccus sp.]
MHAVLVVNAGSSSLKYQLVDPDTGTSYAKGLVERIGLESGRIRHEVDGQRHERQLPVADHVAAIDLLNEAFATHGPDLAAVDLVAVGHRVVHGGSEFADPVVIDDAVTATVERLVPLAPLHNPGNLQGIAATTATFPDTPQVAVFDTAFHQTMPEAAATYAVPKAWREEKLVRRYGFHGTSHAYVSRRVAELMECDLADVKTVVLHLGNGASATAVDGGRSVDTSMGLTPLEGLVMGTRPGDLDPGIAGHLLAGGMTPAELDRALSKESGLLGLAGSADMREVMARRADGDPDAALALDVVIHRLVRYVGAFAAVLGGLDAIVFTAGVGENDDEVRALVLERLGVFGVELDAGANSGLRGQERRITTDASRVQAWVVPTNEEWEIARQAAQVVAAR